MARRGPSWELDREETEFLQSLPLSSISPPSFRFPSLHPGGSPSASQVLYVETLMWRTQCYSSNRNKSYLSLPINSPSLVTLRFEWKTPLQPKAQLHSKRQHRSLNIPNPSVFLSSECPNFMKKLHPIHVGRLSDVLRIEEIWPKSPPKAKFARSPMEQWTNVIDNNCVQNYWDFGFTYMCFK